MGRRKIECANCSGTGRIFHTDTDENEICPACAGACFVWEVQHTDVELLGMVIRQRRSKAGYSMGDLARAWGLSVVDISAIEHGKFRFTEEFLLKHMRLDIEDIPLI